MAQSATPKRIVVFGLSCIIAVLGLPTSIAVAVPAATTWTGAGSSVGGAYPWTDPTNWDNGVPATGGIVTIAPATPTIVSDVPAIQLAELHLIGDGTVDYALTTATAPMAEIDVTGIFEWRSGKVGLGLLIDATPTSTATIRGTTDTNDVAVLEGVLWVEGVGEIGTFGSKPPTGPDDATFVIGRHVLDPQFGGTLWTDGQILIDDGAVMASEDPSAPGLLVDGGGTLASVGPPTGQEVAGSQILDTTVLTDNTATFANRVSAIGTDVGELVFRRDDVTMQYMTFKGGGTILFGAGTAARGVDPPQSDDVILADGTSIQLGEGWDVAQASWDGMAIRQNSAFGVPPSVVTWMNALVVGSAAFSVDLHVTPGSDPNPGSHELRGELVLGKPTWLEGELSLDPAASLSVDTLHLASSSAITGDPSASVTLGDVSFDSPSGARLDIEGPPTTIRQSIHLGANEIILGQDASLNGGGAVIKETISGGVPGATYGAVLGAPGTSGQVVSGSWSYLPTLDPAFAPTRHQRFGVISVPDGSWTGTAHLTFGYPWDPWAVGETPTMGALDYLFVADIAAAGTAPATVQRGSRFRDVVSVWNWGPRVTKRVLLVVHTPPGLRVVRVEAGDATCIHGSQSVHCDLGSIQPSASVDVRILLEAERIGSNVVWVWAHDPSTDDFFPTTNRPRLVTRVK